MLVAANINGGNDTKRVLYVIRNRIVLVTLSFFLLVCLAFVFASAIRLLVIEQPKDVDVTIYVPENAIALSDSSVRVPNAHVVTEDVWKQRNQNRQANEFALVAMQKNFDDLDVDLWLFSGTDTSRAIVTSREIRNPFKEMNGYWTIDATYIGDGVVRITAFRGPAWFTTLMLAILLTMFFSLFFKEAWSRCKNTYKEYKPPTET